MAFPYSGQGGYWVGADKALYRTEPAFRAVLAQCDQLLCEERETFLLDIMFGRDGGAGIRSTCPGRRDEASDVLDGTG